MASRTGQDSVVGLLKTEEEEEIRMNSRSASWRGSFILEPMKLNESIKETVPINPQYSSSTDDDEGDQEHLAFGKISQQEDTYDERDSCPYSQQRNKSQSTKSSLLGKKSGYKKSLYYCIHQDCLKTASFSFEGQRRSFCSKHKHPGMIDVYKPTCHQAECSKKPSFNMIGERKPKFCAQHKLEGMLDVVKPKCIFAECMKRPSFNHEGEKRGLYCGMHRLTGMVDVVKLRCEQKDCTTRASYNDLGNKRGRFCAKHALPEMVQVENSRCEHPGCHVWPSFNFENQRKKRFCAEHKLAGMKRVQKPSANRYKPTTTSYFSNVKPRMIRSSLPLSELQPDNQNYIAGQSSGTKTENVTVPSISLPQTSIEQPNLLCDSTSLSILHTTASSNPALMHPAVPAHVMPTPGSSLSELRNTLSAAGGDPHAAAAAAALPALARLAALPPFQGSGGGAAPPRGGRRRRRR
mmetsp:Transcript_29797/g.48534  ORF Transcript_29797/g.48534 Transcript_29797/m.48534 type:complete len:464 (+) Transcript_29797:29-1420(+)